MEVLGELVHSRMRAANALPSSTLLVAALQLASSECPGCVDDGQTMTTRDILCLLHQAHQAFDPFDHRHAAVSGSLYPAGPWVSCMSVMQALRWLEGELTWRGVRFMSITRAQHPQQVRRQTMMTYNIPTSSRWSLP